MTGTHDTVLDYADFFSLTLRNGNVQEFYSKWDEILLSMTKIPSNDVLESLYKLESVNTSRPYWNRMTWNITRRSRCHQRMKTMVKRRTDLKLRLRNFDAKHQKIESGAVVKNHRGSRGVERGRSICYQADQWKEKEQCSKGDQCSFRRETNDGAKPTSKAEPPSEPQPSRTADRYTSQETFSRHI